MSLRSHAKSLVALSAAAAALLLLTITTPPLHAGAYPPGQATPPAQEPLPPGHPPIDGLPPGHPPLDGLPAGHPPIGAERPPGHPTLTEAPPPPPPPPPAQPEDVQSIDAIVAAYYDSISGPAGQARDWNRFRSLFIPEGRLIATQTGQPAQPGRPAVVLTPDQFVRLNAAYFEQGGYIERDIFRRTETFGNAAHIFSTYETRRTEEDAKPYSRGINSIQLVHDGQRWWIATVLWDYERADNPIPPQYLPAAGEKAGSP